jgi:hypothetical protein
MIRYEVLVKHIDDLRQKRGMTITTFTEGIVSERTYRRYVNEHKVFTFEVLVKLVHKLNMRMRDVLMYAFNQISVSHHEEIYFAHFMTLRNHDLAKPYYEKIKDRPFETHIGSIYLPVLMQYYQYPKDYIKFAKELIDFEKLFHTSYLNRQTLDVLLFILDDVDENDGFKIISYLKQGIQGEITLLSFKHDIDRSMTLHRIIHYMTKTKERLDYFKKDIIPLLRLGLQDVMSKHLISNYELFFESMIMYATHTHNIELKETYIYYDMVNIHTFIQRPLDRSHLYSQEEGLKAYLKKLQKMPLLHKEVI